MKFACPDCGKKFGGDNILASVIKKPTVSFPKPKRPVTIGIGFLCKDNIMVLATDSQMTWPGYKQTGYEKLITVKFRNNFRAILLKAGDWEWANIYHETLVQRAIITDVINGDTIRDVAEDCLRAVREKIQTSYHHPSYPPGATADYLQSRPTKFILAYPTDDGPPRFYTMDLAGAIASRVYHKFAAIGSGSELAAYVLNQIDSQQIDHRAGMGVALYTVEACIAHSEGCGGPPRAIGFSPTGVMAFNSDLFNAQIVDAIGKVQRDYMATLGNTIITAAVSGNSGGPSRLPV